MKLTRDLLIGIISSLAGSLLYAGITAFSGRITHREYADDLLIRALVFGLYVGMASCAAAVLFARRRSQLDSSVKNFRFGRWVRVTALIFIVIGVVPLVWALLPYSIPGLKLSVRNNGEYGVLIPDQVEFFIMVPQTPSSQGVAAMGRCDLSWFTPPQQRDKPLVIASGDAGEFECRILNPRAYRRYLEMEYMNVELYLDDGNGIPVRGAMPFNKEALREHWMVFEFK